MTADESNSYLSYLNKIVYQYNNNYYYPINKNPVNADYSALTEKTALLSISIFLIKVTLKIGQEKYLLLILF